MMFFSGLGALGQTLVVGPLYVPCYLRVSITVSARDSSTCCNLIKHNVIWLHTM